MNGRRVLVLTLAVLGAGGCKSDECKVAETEAALVDTALKPIDLTPGSLRSAAGRFRALAKKSNSDKLRSECESFGTTLTSAATRVENAKGEQMKVRTRKEAQKAVEDGSNQLKARAAADIEELCG